MAWKRFETWSRIITGWNDLRKGYTGFVIASTAILVSSILLSLFLGTVRIPPSEVVKALISAVPGLEGVYDGPEGYRTIILRLRLPILLMGLGVGIALSSSGAALQGLFRNDLVDPFIIGISSGGALGWVLASLVSQGLDWYASAAVKVLMSFFGAMGSVLIAYLVARRGAEVPVTNLLLAGIAVSALFTSAAQVVIYLFVENPAEMIFSLMGGLGNTRWDEVAIVMPIAVFGAAALTLMGRDLNAFSSGEEGAAYLGVRVERSKALIIGVGSLVSAVTIPFCGIIGFVGLIIPHIARRFVGPDLRVLIPSSALLGGGFLVLCDIGSRSVATFVIPLGMVTGLIGGGFFIYLLGIRRWRA